MEETNHPPEDWEIEIHAYDSGNGRVLSLVGELDAHTMGALEGMLSAQESSATSPLVLDLTRIRFMDAAAARRLGQIWHERNPDGCPRLLLRGAGRRIQRVFFLVRAEEVLEPHPSFLNSNPLDLSTPD
ncbi:MAG: STAS domain-containing protein [Candidatus Xenobium sp.]|jgi:anti-anti-sigma factor|nr:STAS domain-containing protein [Burkholderiales bacterium]